MKKYFVDDFGYTWEWDEDEAWLDVVYNADEERPEDSGYLAIGEEDVVEIMLSGGWIEDGTRLRLRLDDLRMKEESIDRAIRATKDINSFLK